MTNHNQSELREAVALLPCPLCGGTAKYRYNELLCDNSMASCTSCGATAFWRKWNRRAPQVAGADWVLVPRFLTQAMLDATCATEDDDDEMRLTWLALLAAAPSASVPQVAGGWPTEDMVEAGCTEMFGAGSKPPAGWPQYVKDAVIGIHRAMLAAAPSASAAEGGENVADLARIIAKSAGLDWDNLPNSNFDGATVGMVTRLGLMNAARTISDVLRPAGDERVRAAAEDAVRIYDARNYLSLDLRNALEAIRAALAQENGNG